MPCSTDVVLTDDAVSADCKADNSKDANKALLSFRKITEGILALKAAAIWPKETKTPAFRDEAATVYLNTVLKKSSKQNLNRCGALMKLPHPLSMNRSVCCIGKNVETEESQANRTKILREAGVLGKIKMVPESLLNLAFQTNSQEALAELPYLYDTYLLFGEIFCRRELEGLLTEKKKRLIRTKNELEIALATTNMWSDSKTKSYIVKVGHTGLTDEQLLENIEAVINYFKRWDKIFPEGIANIKSLQLKTGTSKGVYIHQDGSDEVAADVEDEAQSALLVEEIADAVSALRTAADWPKEETAPAFNSQAATAYLDVLPVEEIPGSEGYFGVLRLPHALSPNRRVCYIGDVETKQQQAEMTEKLKDAGVLGKIKMIPGSLVETAVTNGEDAAITQLVKLYDTHLVEKQVRKSLYWKKLLPVFLMNRKYALDAVPSDFGTSLTKSFIWKNYLNRSFAIKVGHSGLTDEQLQQNIVAVIDFFKRWDLFFPQGFASIRSVQLHSGTGEGISIHQDDSFKERRAVVSRRKRGGIKHKRPAKTKQEDDPIPLKQQREC